MGIDGTGTSETDLLTDGQSVSIDSALPGVWYLEELTHSPAWNLTDISCTSADDSSIWWGELSDQKATVMLAPGDTVECTFTNSQDGTIIVDTVTDPSGDPQAFDFALTGGPDNVQQSFSLADSDPAYDSGKVRPGVYNLSETLPVRWDLTSATCDDGNDPASIQLDPGETVTCIFENTWTKFKYYLPVISRNR